MDKPLYVPLSQKEAKAIADAMSPEEIELCRLKMVAIVAACNYEFALAMFRRQLN